MYVYIYSPLCAPCPWNTRDSYCGARSCCCGRRSLSPRPTPSSAASRHRQWDLKAWRVICPAPENFVVVVVVVDRFYNLYSAILRSRADSLRSRVILHEWLAFYSAFLNIHRSGVLTALAWLVPVHEAAAISAHSVYTIQPYAMSLQAKPHT